MLVLALDTSTPAITAGVVRLRYPHELSEPSGGAGGAVPEPLTELAADRLVDRFGHAEQLMPLIARVLQAAGVTLAELDAVVVGLGPGPYTGLRVGVATAQALGDGCDIPVHGVPSHDALARTLAARQSVAGPEPVAGAGADRDGNPVPEYLLVVTDARRREVYLSGYHRGKRVLGPVVCAPAAVPELLAEHALRPAGTLGVIGDGVDLLPAELSTVELEPLTDLPSGLVAVAARPLVTGVVPGPLTPLYLRRPDATEPAPRRVPLASG